MVKAYQLFICLNLSASCFLSCKPFYLEWSSVGDTTVTLG